MENYKLVGKGKFRLTELGKEMNIHLSFQMMLWKARFQAFEKKHFFTDARAATLPAKPSTE